MGSFKRHRAFDPLDLEIIDRVYEAAWAQLEAREIDRDTDAILNVNRGYVSAFSLLRGSGPSTLTRFMSGFCKRLVLRM